MTYLDQIYLAVVTAVTSVRKRAPYDSGNLSLNAVKMDQINEREYVIYVDEEIAPYMKYTNEDWSNFRPPLFGKKNPNQGWWQSAVGIVVSDLSNQLKGKVAGYD